MKPTFHVDWDAILASDSPIVLELGCGPKKHEGRLGIDRVALPGVDITADLEQGLPFIPDNSIEAIHSRSVLEHIDNLELMMHEIWRVLKPEGRKHLFVPHFSNPYYYSDYTHQRFFGLYSFEYFSSSQQRFKRNVPSFYQDFGFRTEKLRLEFTSPWKSRRFVKKLVERCVNSHHWCQEFYEENCCYMIPCYGIHATLSPIK